MAESLFGLRKYELVPRALECNNFDHFTWWMESADEPAALDDKTWREGALYGRTLRATGEFSKAIQVLSRLLQDVPESVGRFEVAVAFSELGFVLGDVGHFKSVAANLRKAAMISEEVDADYFTKLWRNIADRAFAEHDIYAVVEPDAKLIATFRTLEENATKVEQLFGINQRSCQYCTECAPRRRFGVLRTVAPGRKARRQPDRHF